MALAMSFLIGAGWGYHERGKAAEGKGRVAEGTIWRSETEYCERQSRVLCVDMVGGGPRPTWASV